MLTLLLGSILNPSSSCWSTRVDPSVCGLRGCIVSESCVVRVEGSSPVSTRGLWSQVNQARPGFTKQYKVQVKDKVWKGAYLLQPKVVIKFGVLELWNQSFLFNRSNFISARYTPLFFPLFVPNTFLSSPMSPEAPFVLCKELIHSPCSFNICYQNITLDNIHTSSLRSWDSSL